MARACARCAASSDAAFRLNVREEINEKDELCKEVSLMKDSFEYMVQALRFGSSAFAKNDLDGARKVYQDALTMYQALNNKKGEGIATFNLGATEHRRWLHDATRANLIVTETCGTGHATKEDIDITAEMPLRAVTRQPPLQMPMQRH